MKRLQFETIDGEIFDIDFPTNYDFDEFLAKYWFIEQKIKDAGYQIVIQSSTPKVNEK